MMSSSRRALLSHGAVAVATGALAALLPPREAEAQATGLAPPARDVFETVFSENGCLQVTTSLSGTRLVAVPISITAAGDLASIDWASSRPTLRIGKATPIVITATGVQFGPLARELPWSANVVSRLMTRILASSELQQGAIALRATWMSVYPEYCQRRKAAVPMEIAERMAQSSAAAASYRPGSAASDECRAPTSSASILASIADNSPLISGGSQQRAGCSESCETASGTDIAAESLCFQGRIDQVAGFLGIAEAIVEAVIQASMVCPYAAAGGPGANLAGKIPNPLKGFLDIAEAELGDLVPNVEFVRKFFHTGVRVGQMLLEKFPPVVQCLLDGDWRVTSIDDVLHSFGKLPAIPFGVTVRIDESCADTIINATGLDSFKLISDLAQLIRDVPATVQAIVETITVDITEAEIAGIAGAAQLVIGLIAVLLAHLIIVAGQIFIYRELGMIEDGVCITHPSLVVVAATLLNPLAGIFALGNTPLIVTPPGLLV